jgi:hypothetical protein
MLHVAPVATLALAAALLALVAGAARPTGTAVG